MHHRGWPCDVVEPKGSPRRYDTALTNLGALLLDRTARRFRSGMKARRTVRTHAHGALVAVPFLFLAFLLVPRGFSPLQALWIVAKRQLERNPWVSLLLLPFYLASFPTAFLTFLPFELWLQCLFGRQRTTPSLPEEEADLHASVFAMSSLACFAAWYVLEARQRSRDSERRPRKVQ